MNRWCAGLLLASAVVLPIAAVQVPSHGPVIVPVEREPQHTLAFKNDVVTVLDVRFPPGYTSLFHTHSHDNVSVRIETSRTRTDTLEAQGTEQTAPIGRVLFYSAAPPYTHRVANVGTSAVRVIDVEIVSTSPARTSVAPDQTAGHETILENGRVRLSRLTVAPGQVVPAHTHARARLDVVVRGDVPGAFAWRDAGSMTPTVTAGPSGAEWVEIEIK